MLVGGAGNDTLSGCLGADTMIGGTGNDTYTVDNAADVVTENPNEGNDTVVTSVNYALGAELENLTGSSAIGLALDGNDLDNRITSGAGNDSMVGGTGNDTYVVDNALDVVSENAGEGTDTVWRGSTTRSPRGPRSRRCGSTPRLGLAHRQRLSHSTRGRRRQRHAERRRRRRHAERRRRCRRHEPAAPATTPTSSTTRRHGDEAPAAAPTPCSPPSATRSPPVPRSSSCGRRALRPHPDRQHVLPYDRRRRGQRLAVRRRWRRCADRRRRQRHSGRRRRQRHADRQCGQRRLQLRRALRSRHHQRLCRRIAGSQDLVDISALGITATNFATSVTIAAGAGVPRWLRSAPTRSRLRIPRSPTSPRATSSWHPDVRSIGPPARSPASADPHRPIVAIVTVTRPPRPKVDTSAVPSDDARTPKSLVLPAPRQLLSETRQSETTHAACRAQMHERGAHDARTSPIS